MNWGYPCSRKYPESDAVLAGNKARSFKAARLHGRYAPAVLCLAAFDLPVSFRRVPI